MVNKLDIKWYDRSIKKNKININLTNMIYKNLTI